MAVNPNDPRTGIGGQKVRLPIVDRLGADYPGRACRYRVWHRRGEGHAPAHDPNDFEIGKRHNLPFITMMNKDATINAEGREF